jgi:uncharacterized phage protein (TIGR02220 family)
VAIYRNVQLSFWTDNKVEDEFTPEDKYFYLYLLTNPQTNLCGCYEVSWSQLTNQTGYNKETVKRLLDRFEKVHNVIRFDEKTKEILVLNWGKYNWNKSEKVLKGVESVAVHIKSETFKNYVFEAMECVKNDTVCIGYQYGMDTSVTVTVTDTVSDTDTVSVIKDIIDYLNLVAGTNYKYKTKNTQKHINARLAEGYEVEDFKTVIDKKANEWRGTEMEKYLRPETLFGNKFEGYLNQTIVTAQGRQPSSKKINWDDV